MIWRINQVVLSSLWILVFALCISAIRIPRLSSDFRTEYSQKPLMFMKDLAQLDLDDLPSTNLEPLHFKEYGAKRILMRYGPYMIPPVTQKNGMKEFNDMAANKPCTNCYITGLQAGLEYLNGSYANSNTGMWLHHVVLYDFSRKDTSCPETVPAYRFFASGNERTRLDMTLNG
jgi:hypothetical protein